jgi:sulfite exporter TauE/SafE
MNGWIEAIALAAFTAGLMGGLHCAAMCGGVVCLLSGSAKNGGSGIRWSFALAYNAGRIASYASAGALVGAVGQAGLLLRGSLPVQQVLMLAAGLTLCMMALYLAGISPLMRTLEGAGSVLWRQVQPVARHVLPVTTLPRALGLGALWGWLPCGMVYAALLLAVSSANPLHGALVMLAFGLGTLPNVLLISGTAGHLQRAIKRRGVRWVAAALLSVMGLYALLHAVHPLNHQLGGLITLLCSAMPGM